MTKCVRELLLTNNDHKRWDMLSNDQRDRVRRLIESNFPLDQLKDDDMRRGARESLRFAVMSEIKRGGYASATEAMQ